MTLAIPSKNLFPPFIGQEEGGRKEEKEGGKNRGREGGRENEDMNMRYRVCGGKEVNVNT